MGGRKIMRMRRITRRLRIKRESQRHIRSRIKRTRKQDREG